MIYTHINPKATKKIVSPLDQLVNQANQKKKEETDENHLKKQKKAFRCLHPTLY
jgi:hypothetical protein